MFRLVLVDDEWAILNGLRHNIPWKELGFEISGTFLNGARALESIRDNVPDVILTDIKMPMTDGISMVKALRELGLDRLKVVFLSGYDDFQYAQASTRLGAVDYILKPSNPEDIKRVFRKIYSQLEQEHQDYLQMEKNRYIMNESLPMLKARLFNCVLHGDDGQNTGFLEEYLRQFAQPEKTGFTAVSFTLPPIAAMEAVSDDLTDTLQKFRKICADYFAFHSSSNGLLDRYTYYFETLWISAAVFSCTAPADIVLQLEALAEKVRDEGLPGFAYAVGSTCPDLRQTGLSWENSLQSLFRRVRWNNRGYLRTLWSDSGLFTAIQSREPDELGARLNRWLQDAGTEQACWQTLAYHLYLSFLSSGSPKGLAEELWMDLQSQAKSMNASSFCNTAVNFLQAESMKTDLSCSKNLKRSLEIARYISDRFDEDISLAALSQRFFMSPNYISRIFKENMGMGVKEYLTKVRLDRANQLIREGNLKLYQIAEQIGYPNYEYFRKIYSRHMGHNPSSSL